MLDRLDAAGIDVTVKLASTDLGVVDVYAVGCSRDASEPIPIMATACGEAAHPDRDTAVRKALHEFAAARTREAFMHGPLAAKVLVPGTEVESMSYDRIGERGVARLREWGDLLVAVGADPGSWGRVHLSAEAEERLGGSAWFDRDGARRRVGALYPLYREPGRHVAAQVPAGVASGGRQQGGTAGPERRQGGPAGVLGTGAGGRP